MKRVLLVQPSLQPPGGGNSVAAWIVQALKDECDIDVLCWRGIELEPINRHYGTSLDRTDFVEIPVRPAWLRVVLDLIPIPLSLLKSALMLRLCKKWKDRYDVIITANNEADFGCRGIQYVHYPWGARPRPPEDLRWYHFSETALRVYYVMCQRLSDYSAPGMKRNFTLTNSVWIADKLRELHAIKATVVRPPIAGDFAAVPWDQRKDGFVCIGRIAPEKELEKIIDIVRALRARRHDVHLHIIGSPDDRSYCNRIRQLGRENDSWVFIDENVSRQELVRLVTAHRYGIHGMVDEHFGMAVAEMVRGGCLVFVPNGGGQVEVVGDEPYLRYDSPADAVEKISRVLGDENTEGRLREHLARRANLFTVEHFVEEVREIVRRF